MICPKCGTTIEDGSKVCSQCGATINVEPVKQEEPKSILNVNTPDVTNAYKKPSPERNNLWAAMSVFSFIVSSVPFYKGYDKMTNMFSYKNSYVGGDAYNMIANASFSTSYFVLGVGLCLLGIGFLILYYLSDSTR